MFPSTVKGAFSNTEGNFNIVAAAYSPICTITRNTEDENMSFVWCYRVNFYWILRWPCEKGVSRVKMTSSGDFSDSIHRYSIVYIS